MNSQSKHLTRRLFGSVVCIVALCAATARGDGSIFFNGTNSKIQNDNADILNTQTQITVCAWVFAESTGGGGNGSILRLDEQGDKIIFGYEGPGTDMHWRADSGHWTFPLGLGGWRAISVTYDFTSSSAPVVRVNFAPVTVTPVVSWTSDLPATGYCIGNHSGGTTGWHGKIAHVQVFNRVLTPAEADRALLTPGSVTKDLRLWLPMTNLLDTYDRSGNGHDGTAAYISTGKDWPPIDKVRGLAPGIVMLPSGITPIGQFVIPRYNSPQQHPSGNSPQDHPSGELRGSGPMSIIAATPETVNQPNPAVVVTEGNHVSPPEDISEWQVGSSNATAPAVLQPTLTNCTVIGYIANYDWTQEGVVNDQPRMNDQGEPDLYGGADLYGNGGVVYNVGFFGIPGTACKLTRRGSSRQGFQLEHDRLRWKIERCYARRCYRGFEIGATDMTAGDIEVEAVRDWGVKINDSVQFGTIHVYGCGYPGAPGGGAAMWITGQQNMGGPVYLENATIGLNDSGQHTTINGITSHTCDSYNMKIAGAGGKYFGVDLRRAPINIRFEGDGNVVHAGVIQLAEAGKGIEYNDGTVVDSSSGANNVRDIVINGYGDKDMDGTIEAGEEFADNAIGIDVNTTLKFVNITGIYIDSCTKGIDFSGGGNIANDGSVIWINTTTSGPGTVTTPVTWPDGQTWSTTPNANDKRDIRINGMRYYQQGI
jgi:hypothetical protein